MEENKDYKEQIEFIDLQSIRPLRSMMIGTGTADDVSILKELEQKAIELRKKIKDTV